MAPSHQVGLVQAKLRESRPSAGYPAETVRAYVLVRGGDSDGGTSETQVPNAFFSRAWQDGASSRPVGGVVMDCKKL